MATISAEEIPRILTARGWNPRSLDARTWRCTVPSGAGPVRFVLRHAGTWLYVAVMPFLDPESVKPWGGGRYPARFLGRILAVNANLAMAKFALDDDGDLTLRVELPTESLQPREVETALSLMYTTTEQYRTPIRDALLDAGRAAESAAAMFDAPPLSDPPPMPGGEGDEAGPAISVAETTLNTPDEAPPASREVAEDPGAPLPSGEAPAAPPEADAKS